MNLLLQYLTSQQECVVTFEVSTLRERVRTHKVFTKKRCFYLNYHKFSIKSYVLDVY